MAAPASADPIFPEAQVNLLTPKNPGVGRVVSSELCMKGKSSSFVRHLSIDVSGTPLAGNFRVGQSFGVIAPGVDENGRPHSVRLYSIACPDWGEDGRGNVVSTTPKRVIQEDGPADHALHVGVCSNFLCDIEPGDEVTVTGPAGKRFLLPANPADHDFLFIAGGTGIAPFRGMAMQLLEHPDGPVSSRIALVAGAPYTTDLLYDDLFTRFADEHAGFSYHAAVSREPRPDGSPGGHVDRLIEERIDEFRELIASPRTLIYVCGMIGMDTDLYGLLDRHGLADAYVSRGDEKNARPRPTARCLVEVY